MEAKIASMLQTTPPAPLALLRLQKGLKQRSVADALGLNASALYRLERGLAWPSARRILDLAKVLQVEPEDLLLEAFCGWQAAHSNAAPTIAP